MRRLVKGNIRLRTTVDVGAVVRDRRLLLRLSQAALARKARVGREWIIELEKGKPRVPLAMVLRTMEALGIALTAHPEAPGGKPRSAKTEGRGGVDLGAVLQNLQRPPRNSPPREPQRKKP
jgi:HTH-type transcriptional regulator/antitoxin HipB